MTVQQVSPGSPRFIREKRKGPEKTEKTPTEKGSIEPRAQNEERHGGVSEGQRKDTYMGLSN